MDSVKECYNVLYHTLWIPAMLAPMPPDFPDAPFLKFGQLAGACFPPALSDEALADPLQRGQHFDLAWRAVRYRYRLCAECNDEFKSAVANAPELWREWSALDDEHAFRVDRSIYMFFMSGLSVFESLSFSLYFWGSMLQPGDFPYIEKPKRITRDTTIKAFTAAFPSSEITRRLTALPNDADFSAIDDVRNILAHRSLGRRNIRSWGTTHADGTFTSTREEAWYLPGPSKELVFDGDLLQRHLDKLTSLLTGLTAAALQFVEQNRPAGAPP